MSGHHFRIEQHASVGSTNDLVRDRALAGEPEGLVVQADLQTGGRGRHGRRWVSPPGNLYASLLLRPTRPLAQTPSLALVIGLSLADAIAAAARGRLEPRLKWPNDVLLDGAKLAGVLLESLVQGSAAPTIVAGVGVNLRSSPAGLAYATTCLAAQGLALEPVDLLDRFLARFAADYALWQRAGFAACRERWLARAHGLGQPVEVRAGATPVTGRLAQVDAAGRLVVETAAGPRALDAGELFVASPAGVL